MARVVLLAGQGRSTWIVANALSRAQIDTTVIIEDPVPRARFLRTRLRRLGPVTVFGQLLFKLWSRMAQSAAEPRLREIMAEAGLDDTPRSSERYRNVASANDPTTAALIAEAAPEVVVVNGTRILSRALLDTIPMPVLNMHSGITPAYRGVHGGYWARGRGDMARCGVTVHRVDPGVDTGDVVAQARIEPGQRDTFFTYPMLQLAAGLPLLLQAVADARAGRLAARPGSGESRQYYHPTLWGYIATGLRRGVW